MKFTFDTDTIFYCVLLFFAIVGCCFCYLKYHSDDDDDDETVAELAKNKQNYEDTRQNEGLKSLYFHDF